MVFRKIDASTLNYPATLGMHLIDFFNSSLSPGEPSREFIGTKEIDEDTRMKMENTMIKFEEHYGMLFSMLDKPAPLTPDSKLPCLIRPIQDDSPMGRYVKQCWGHDEVFMSRKYTIDDINADMAAKVGFARDTPISIHMFEIIGTHVKEGSVEWALHQLMQGIVVCQLNGKPIYLDGDYIKCGNIAVYHIKDFLSKTAPDGWQIYEPKPELKYKAGDFVEIINWYSGTKHLGQIDSIDHEIHIGTHRFDISGKSVMERVPQLSIIHKLKPSEVIVNIGCLSGTIKDLSYAEDGRFWFIGGKTERCPGGMHAILYDEMLDTPTRKLVESLLKAQEEKK